MYTKINCTENLMGVTILLLGLSSNGLNTILVINFTLFPNPTL